MIYIIKLDETNWNSNNILQGQRPIKINEKGHQNSKFIAKKVKTLNFNKIISSDLLHAKEITAIINENIQKEIIYDARLRSINYGNLEGRYLPDITHKEWKIYYLTPEKLGAESLESVYKRIKSLFDDLIEYNENVLVVAHYQTLNFISYYMSNRNIFDIDVYLKFYKNSKQIVNNILFELISDYDELKSIY